MVARQLGQLLELDDHLGDGLGVVPRLEVAADRRVGDLVAGPRAKGMQGRAGADLGVRPAELALDPVEQVEEGVGVEPLVVHGPQVLRTHEALLERVRLGILEGVGEPERRRGDQQVHRAVRADRLVDDPVRLDLERQHVAAVLGTSRRLAVVQRPLVEREDRLLGLGLDLGAELHPLGEDDLLLGGEQRHAADLTQVQANGVVGVEDLGRLRLGLLGVGLGGLRGGCRLGRLGGDLHSHGREGLRLQGGDLGIELDRGGREGGLSLGHGRFGLGDRGSRRVERNHVAPADEVVPSRTTSG